MDYERLVCRLNTANKCISTTKNQKTTLIIHTNGQAGKESSRKYRFTREEKTSWRLPRLSRFLDESKGEFDRSLSTCYDWRPMETQSGLELIGRLRVLALNTRTSCKEGGWTRSTFSLRIILSKASIKFILRKKT